MCLAPSSPDSAATERAGQGPCEEPLRPWAARAFCAAEAPLDPVFPAPELGLHWEQVAAEGKAVELRALAPGEGLVLEQQQAQKWLLVYTWC